MNATIETLDQAIVTVREAYEAARVQSDNMRTASAGVRTRAKRDALTASLQAELFALLDQKIQQASASL